MNIVEVQLPSRSHCIFDEEQDQNLHSNFAETKFMSFLAREYSLGTTIHGLPVDSFIQHAPLMTGKTIE